MTRSRSTKKTLGSWGDSFSSLESRVLLSGDDSIPGSSVSTLNWHGAVVDVVKDSWIVSFSGKYEANQAVAKAQEVAANLGVRVQDIRSIGSGYNAVFTSLDAIRETDVSRVLTRVGGVLSVEPNILYRPDALPNDTLLSRQWGLINTGQDVPAGSGLFGLFGADIDAALAWDRTVGSQSIIIGVVDSGIDLSHPDLIANIWHNPGEIAGDGVDNDGNGYVDDVTGYDFGEGDANPTDVDGHGTSVAGIIGAVGNNTVGVSGVAWNVSILPIKVARASAGGAFPADALIAAQDYMVQFITMQGRNIVASNNSYGSLQARDNPSVAEEAAIRRFTDTGATFVASAGNDGANVDGAITHFPSSFNQTNSAVISVGATNNLDELSDFSNSGILGVNIAAPGEQIYTTTIGGGYGYFDGTSASSPFVTGAVVLLKAVKPNASSQEVIRALTRGADRIDSLQNQVASGGRLNVNNALRNILIEGPTVTGVFPGSVASNVTTIVISFSEPITSPVLNGFISLVGSGGDGLFGNGNDVGIAVQQSYLAVSGNLLTITLTGAFPSGLPTDNYRLIIDAEGVRDADGNYLNGNLSLPLPADDEVINFQVVENSGAFEPNDSVSIATPVVFNASGQAVFANAAIGDGLQNAKDVDIYRFSLSGPGLIVATVDARSLPLPSTLDSVLYLFDAASLALNVPVAIAVNDNFNGLDSRVEFFVPTGGTYYLLVAGFGNSTFDPRVIGSGRDGSTGDYTLTIDVAVDSSDSVSFDAPNVPVAIPDPIVGVPQTLSNVINVFDTRRIADLNVRMTITHPFDSDLQIRLRHHIEGDDVSNDRVVSLVLSRGGSGDDFIATIFDDEANQPIGLASAPFTGSFRPETTLNRFDGQTASGAWTLEITDARSPSIGTLLDWGLDFTLINDVFGPFELNDTIGLAADPILTDVGTATRDAFIGDGAFGARDVDLFRVEAAAGTTLTATINVPLNASDPIGGPSTNHLDVVLRLFDVAGNELVLDNRADTQNASLSFTVGAGGVFFIGVSGADNTSYSILAGGSGSSTSATGNYRLTVQVVGGISNGAVFLHGDDSGVSVGVNADGSLGVPNGSTPAGSDEVPVGVSLNGNELLLGLGTASESFWGATFNGFSFQNSGPAGRTDLQVAVADQSSPSNARANITGIFRGLDISRTLSFSASDHFVAVDVTLTNTTASDISDVAFVEAFDPQIGLNRQTNLARTVNNVDNDTGRLATASFTDNAFPGGLTIALAAASAPDGGRVVASVEELGSVRDPFQVLDNAAPDPDASPADAGVEADRMLALAFGLNEGESLSPGASFTFRYFILVGSSVDEVRTAFATLEADTGTGHFVQDPQGLDLDRGYDSDTGQSTLPYTLYYPEGYANDRASTFLPISNPNDAPARVVVIARYENGVRDQVIYDSATATSSGVVAPHSRPGLTITPSSTPPRRRWSVPTSRTRLRSGPRSPSPPTSATSISAWPPARSSPTAPATPGPSARDTSGRASTTSSSSPTPPTAPSR